MASGSALKTYHSTLTATTVDTVTLAWSKYVSVINKSSTDSLYVTTDGSDPTVAGANTYFVGPEQSKMLANEGLVPEPAIELFPSTVVKLISSGTPSYCVEKN